MLSPKLNLVSELKSHSPKTEGTSVWAQAEPCEDCQDGKSKASSFPVEITFPSDQTSEKQHPCLFSSTSGGEVGPLLSA